MVLGRGQAVCCICLNQPRNPWQCFAGKGWVFRTTTLHSSMAWLTQTVGSLGPCWNQLQQMNIWWLDWAVTFVRGVRRCPSPLMWHSRHFSSSLACPNTKRKDFFFLEPLSHRLVALFSIICTLTGPSSASVCAVYRLKMARKSQQCLWPGNVCQYQFPSQPWHCAAGRSYSAVCLADRIGKVSLSKVASKTDF